MLAIRFEQDRARLGLPAAVNRLRDALACNGLTLEGDERLLAGVLADRISPEVLAESICSMQRMALTLGTEGLCR
jgi:hypothetical protein